MWAGLFWIVIFGVAHAIAHHEIKEFIKFWGNNLFVAAGPRRRDGGSTWAIGYGMLVACFVLGRGDGGEKLSDVVLVFLWILVPWGGLVAWRVGEAIELKTMSRDIIEKTAKEQVRQGIYNPPPPPPPPIDPEKEARGVVKWLENMSRQSGRPVSQQELDDTYDYYKARYQWEREQASTPASPRVVGGEVTFNRPVAQPHDGGVFDFDPARFKHGDPQPQALPAPPRMIGQQHDYEHHEWQNEELARPSRQAAAQQPASSAQPMPSFTFDGSKVWK